MIIEKKGSAWQVADNPFTGRTIVVTGKLVHFTRDTINAKIVSLGATAGSAVSKNTDYLICGDKAGSKLDKATALGIKVLTEQQFLNMAESA
jgi:DNA ligase (NAD+)